MTKTHVSVLNGDLVIAGLQVTDGVNVSNKQGNLVFAPGAIINTSGADATFTSGCNILAGVPLTSESDTIPRSSGAATDGYGGVSDSGLRAVFDVSDHGAIAPSTTPDTTPVSSGGNRRGGNILFIAGFSSDSNNNLTPSETGGSICLQGVRIDTSSKAGDGGSVQLYTHGVGQQNGGVVLLKADANGSQTVVNSSSIAGNGGDVIIIGPALRTTNNTPNLTSFTTQPVEYQDGQNLLAASFNLNSAAGAAGSFSALSCDTISKGGSIQAATDQRGNLVATGDVLFTGSVVATGHPPHNASTRSAFNSVIMVGGNLTLTPTDSIVTAGTQIYQAAKGIYIGSGRFAAGTWNKSEDPKDPATYSTLIDPKSVITSGALQFIANDGDITVNQLAPQLTTIGGDICLGSTGSIIQPYIENPLADPNSPVAAGFTAVARGGNVLLWAGRPSSGHSSNNVDGSNNSVSVDFSAIGGSCTIVSCATNEENFSGGGVQIVAGPQASDISRILAAHPYNINGVTYDPNFVQETWGPGLIGQNSNAPYNALPLGKYVHLHTDYEQSGQYLQVHGKVQMDESQVFLQGGAIIANAASNSNINNPWSTISTVAPTKPLPPTNFISHNLDWIPHQDGGETPPGLMVVGNYGADVPAAQAYYERNQGCVTCVVSIDFMDTTGQGAAAYGGAFGKGHIGWFQSGRYAPDYAYAAAYTVQSHYMITDAPPARVDGGSAQFANASGPAGFGLASAVPVAGHPNVEAGSAPNFSGAHPLGAGAVGNSFGGGVGAGGIYSGTHWAGGAGSASPMGFNGAAASGGPQIGPRWTGGAFLAPGASNAYWNSALNQMVYLPQGWHSLWDSTANTYMAVQDGTREIWNDIAHQKMLVPPGEHLQLNQYAHTYDFVRDGSRQYFDPAGRLAYLALDQVRLWDNTTNGYRIVQVGSKPFYDTNTETMLYLPPHTHMEFDANYTHTNVIVPDGSKRFMDPSGHLAYLAPGFHLVRVTYGSGMLAPGEIANPNSLIAIRDGSLPYINQLGQAGYLPPGTQSIWDSAHGQMLYSQPGSYWMYDSSHNQMITSMQVHGGGAGGGGVGFLDQLPSFLSEDASASFDSAPWLGMNSINGPGNWYGTQPAAGSSNNQQQKSNEPIVFANDPAWNVNDNLSDQPSGVRDVLNSLPSTQQADFARLIRLVLSVRPDQASGIINLFANNELTDQETGKFTQKALDVYSRMAEAPMQIDLSQFPVGSEPWRQAVLYNQGLVDYNTSLNSMLSRAGNIAKMNSDQQWADADYRLQVDKWNSELADESVPLVDSNQVNKQLELARGEIGSRSSGYWSTDAGQAYITLQKAKIDAALNIQDANVRFEFLQKLVSDDKHEQINAANNQMLQMAIADLPVQLAARPTQTELEIKAETQGSNQFYGNLGDDTNLVDLYKRQNPIAIADWADTQRLIAASSLAAGLGDARNALGADLPETQIVLYKQRQDEITEEAKNYAPDSQTGMALRIEWDSLQRQIDNALLATNFKGNVAARTAANSIYESLAKFQTAISDFDTTSDPYARALAFNNVAKSLQIGKSALGLSTTDSFDPQQTVNWLGLQKSIDQVTADRVNQTSDIMANIDAKYGNGYLYATSNSPTGYAWSAGPTDSDLAARGIRPDIYAAWKDGGASALTAEQRIYLNQSWDFIQQHNRDIMFANKAIIDINQLDAQKEVQNKVLDANANKWNPLSGSIITWGETKLGNAYDSIADTMQDVGLDWTVKIGVFVKCCV